MRQVDTHSGEGNLCPPNPTHVSSRACQISHSAWAQVTCWRVVIASACWDADGRKAVGGDILDKTFCGRVMLGRDLEKLV